MINVVPLYNTINKENNNDILYIILFATTASPDNAYRYVESMYWQNRTTNCQIISKCTELQGPMDS